MAANPLTSPDQSRYEVLTDADLKGLYPKVSAPAPAPVSAPAPAVSRSAPTISDLTTRAEELGIDPKLARAFFSQESSGNWNSRDSAKGARGGMQVMPGTYKQMMGTDQGQSDPWNNMEAGLRYIRYGMDRLKTSDPVLLAAGYHAGYDRPELKRGEIPDTNDGQISTADYARSVAGRFGVNMPQPTARKAADPLADLNKDEPGRYEIVQPEADPLAALNAQEPGRYEVLPEAEAIKFKTDSTPQDGSGNLLTDIGKGLKVGANIAAQDARELVNRIPGVGPAIVSGLDKVDEYFSGKPSDKLLKDDTEAMTKSMTPGMQAALQKKWWDSDKGSFGDAWKDPRAYIGGVVQSLPEQALTMVPAMRLAKFAFGAKLAAGATAEAAAAAAARTATVAGGVSEGLLGGAQSAREVRDKVLELPPDVLAQSEAFQTLLKSGMTPDQAQKTLAEDTATRAFVTSGVATGLFGGMGDRAIAKIMVEKVGGPAIKRVLRNVAKGTIAEGLFEELPQSALQQLTQNEAIRQANPNQSLTEDVANQAIGGAVLGGLQGGGMAAVAGHGGAHAPAAPAQPPAQAPAAPEAPGATAQAPGVTPEAPINPVPNAPSTARGPLERATENAATTPDRVTATAPDGSQVQGTVLGTADDGKVQIVTDDGEIATFRTGPGGVKIDIEAPNTPLSNAIEAAAIDHAETAAPAAEAVSQPKTESEPQAAPAQAEAITPQPAQEPAKNLSEMDEPALRERLKYIADQAKTNGGWNALLTKARREVEKEINARQKAAQPELAPVQESKPAEPTAMPAAEAPKPAQPADQLADLKRQWAEAAQAGDTEKAASINEQIRTLKAGATPEAKAPGTQEATPARADGAEPAAGLPDTRPVGDGGPVEAVGVDPKKQKALDRIAAGKAWFNDGVKAKDFITKNGLAETHEALKGKGGRWDIVTKLGFNSDFIDTDSEGTLNTEGLGAKRTLKERSTVQPEPTNGSDNRTDRRPDGAQEVERRQEAQPAAQPAAAVQPDAAPASEKVAEPARASEQFAAYEKAIREGQASPGMMEQIFSGLESRGKAKKDAEQALAEHPEAAKLRYVEDNFWALLSDLEETGKVEIKC